MAVLVGVAVARAGAPRADAAQHRAGVAANDAVVLDGAELLGAGFCRQPSGGLVVGTHNAPSLARSAAHRRCGSTGTWRTVTPVACRMAPRIAGGVAISAGSPTPLAP